MSDIQFSPRAYTKMILHASKYPHLAVNGVLLAEKDKSGKSLQIVDAVPLFHQCLYVTPMAEVALVQIDAAASVEGQHIAGYYVAAENFGDNSIERAPGHKVADKIAEHLPNACFVVIDNKSIGLKMSKPAINVWQAAATDNPTSRWQKNDAFRLEQSDDTLDAVSKLVQRGAAKDLQDFDNHLDNVANDWTNEHLNRDLKQLLAMY